ncbi:MAG: FAD-dependent thymidylate synthase [Chloroflexota bacterium]
MTEEVKNLIGQELKCLDKGFVRLIDVMGDDDAVVQAARVSYGKGTKSVMEDSGLIRYLMRNRHTSPFEMVEFKFHVKLPIFVARQWIRHRTASVNEYSGRYSEMGDEFYVPERDQIRSQSDINKQGRASSALEDEKTDEILKQLEREQYEIFEGYETMLQTGLARELARINLPLSSYTQWYWKIDMHNLFHFLKLRMDPHAQYEIRVYAETIAEIVKAAAPVSYEAFNDYILESVTFSKPELLALRTMLSKADLPENIPGLSNRERTEFSNKLNSLLNL